MRLSIGIPVVGDVPGEVFQAMVNLGVSAGREFREVILPAVRNIFPHDRAREAIVKLSLEHKADLLLFVDADMEVPANALKLLVDAKERTGAKVVAAATPRRGYPYTTTWFTTHEGSTYQATAEPDAGPVEISSCGLACTLIDLGWVRANLTEPYFFMGCLKPHDTSSFVWEDSYFCNKVREANGKIVGDPRVRCGHLGDRELVTHESGNLLRRRALQKEREYGSGREP